MLLNSLRRPLLINISILITHLIAFLLLLITHLFLELTKFIRALLALQLTETIAFYAANNAIVVSLVEVKKQLRKKYALSINY